MVFDPRSEEALVIMGTDLFLAVVSKPLSKESGYVIRVHGMDGCLDDFIIERLQVFRGLEDDIRSAFNLHNRP